MPSLPMNNVQTLAPPSPPHLPNSKCFVLIDNLASFLQDNTLRFHNLCNRKCHRSYNINSSNPCPSENVSS